jgi:hypothetical protein
MLRRLGRVHLGLDRDDRALGEALGALGEKREPGWKQAGATGGPRPLQCRGLGKPWPRRWLTCESTGPIGKGWPGQAGARQGDKGSKGVQSPNLRQSHKAQLRHLPTFLKNPGCKSNSINQPDTQIHTQSGGYQDVTCGLKMWSLEPRNGGRKAQK